MPSGDFSPVQTELRQRLIQSARELAEAGGYRAVTMKAIAERCQVSRVTTYKYFRNKDQALAEVTVNWSEEMIELLAQENLADGSLSERIGQRLSFIIRHLLKSPRLLEAVLAASTTPGTATVERTALQPVMRNYLGPTFDELPRPGREDSARILGYILNSILQAVSSGRISPEDAEADLYMAIRLMLHE
jgi:AcrR family transcriptional regulator